MSLQDTVQANGSREETLRLSHLIKEKDEERICYNSRRCCRKRRCCVCLVYASLIEESIFLLATFIFNAVVFIQFGNDKDKEEARFLQMSLLKVFLAFMPNTVIMFMRIYYGFRWICKGHTRRNFIPYYRLSLTSIGSQLIMTFCLDFILFVSNSPYLVAKKSHTYDIIIYIVFEILSIIFVHIYMKYLDAVNIVKNDVARKKQDFHYYHQ